MRICQRRNRKADLEVVARSLSDSKALDEPADYGVRLLSDARAVFEANKADRLASYVLLNGLNNIDESPWFTWSHGRELDARGLSTLLRPFGIHPQNIRRDDNSVVKGYLRESFVDAWDSYLPPSRRYTATDRINIGQNRDSASATEPHCSGRQK
jgi:hypothetical protein